MRQHQLPWKTLILALVAASTAVSSAIYWLAGWFTAGEVWAAIGKIGTVNLITCCLWEAVRRWGWRLPFAQRFFQWPDLSGQWNGSITSSYNGVTIPVSAEIRQTLTSISIAMKPDSLSSESCSFAATICSDPEAGRCQLIYSFSNRPIGACGTLDKHYGTAIFTVTDCSPTTMHGTYMTDREPQTKGSIALTKRIAAAAASA